jgi:hypothetical protein
MDASFGRWGIYWWNHLEVHIDSIDSFSRVGEISWRPKHADLASLKNIPEAAIKRAFASILFEELFRKIGVKSVPICFLAMFRLIGSEYHPLFCLKGQHNSNR